MHEELQAHFAELVPLSEPTERMRPSSRRMFRAGFLAVRGARLTFCDSWCTPLEGVDAVVRSGIYQIEVEVQAYGRDGRIARLIVSIPGSQGQRGRKLGSFDVDVASAAVCDGDVLTAFATHHKHDWQTWIDELIQRPNEVIGLFGSFKCEGAATEAFYVNTGFGDGSYPVFELLEGDQIVGAEAVFLWPDQGYFAPGPGEDDAG